MEIIIPSGLFFDKKSKNPQKMAVLFMKKRIYYVKAAFVENFKK